jgi:hypothetical protein
MSFYDSQNQDPWGSAFGSSTPAYSSQPVSQSPASPAFQDSSFGSAPAYSSQPNYQSPASPAFQAAPVIQPGAVPVIDTVNLQERTGLRFSQKR